MKKFGNALWGAILVILGLIISCNVLGITNIDIFFDGWWTLFIIIPSVIGLFSEKEKTSNIIGVLIGVVLLCCCQGILDFDLVWKLAFPALLIIVGLSIIFKDVFNSKINDTIKKLNNNIGKENTYCATFSGQNINFDGEKFNGIDLTAVFGGVKCDLRNAIIENDVVINTTNIFGGTDILIPENIKVKVKSNSIFGGVDEKNKNVGKKEERPIIYINANCIFGGVELK